MPSLFGTSSRQISPASRINIVNLLIVLALILQCRHTSGGATQIKERLILTSLK